MVLGVMWDLSSVVRLDMRTTIILLSPSVNGLCCTVAVSLLLNMTSYSIRQKAKVLYSQKKVFLTIRISI